MAGFHESLRFGGGDLKHGFHWVFYCKVSVTRVSIGYSPKLRAMQATQAFK